MDAKDYDRLADVLMQFKGKLPLFYLETDTLEKKYVNNAHQSINELLILIDTMAKMDDKGWL